MATVTREQLHAMIDVLRDDDLERARKQLDQLRVNNEKEPLDSLRQELFDKGFLSQVAPPASPDAIRRHRERKLVTIKGEPLSDTIIKDRGPLD